MGRSKFDFIGTFEFNSFVWVVIIMCVVFSMVFGLMIAAEIAWTFGDLSSDFYHQMRLSHRAIKVENDKAAAEIEKLTADIKKIVNSKRRYHDGKMVDQNYNDLVMEVFDLK